MLPSYDNLKNSILEWNIRYPVDRWFREKYNIAFGSPAHRVSCLIDMYLQHEEDKLYYEFEKSKEVIEDKQTFSKYIPGQGIVLNNRGLTQEEITEQYDNTSLDNFEL